MVQSSPQAVPRDDYDTPWKTALERYLPEFLAFYFPAAYAGIDWTHAPRFLDKELAQVVQDAELGKRYVDKLVAVRLRGVGSDGAEEWVYIHVEIQGGHDSDFPKRMFTYNYRLFDRFGRAVASLAVLADDSPDWRPASFGFELFGCRHRLEYPLVKLIDHAPHIEALLADENPFALVTAAHLLTQRTRHDHAGRYAAKWRLARLLYERDWGRQRIIDLFALIDWLMRLPPELEEQLWQALGDLERTKAMPYVTSVERIGFQRGHVQGLEQGLEQGREEGRRAEAALVARQLRRRLGPLTGLAEGRIATLNSAELEALGEALLDFSQRSDLDTWLERHGG